MNAFEIKQYKRKSNCYYINLCYNYYNIILLFSIVATGIIAWLTREKSPTKYLSLKATCYYYKNNTGKGFVPKWNKTIYQVRGTYYEKENYKGSSYKKTMYEVISY